LEGGEIVFQGYCFIEKDGEYCPPVTLESVPEVFNYVQLQKRIFPEVRICDEEDFTVVQALDGKITFPPEWVQAFEGGEKTNES